MGFPNCRENMKINKKRYYPNIPMSLPKIADTISKIKNVSYEKVASITTFNAKKFLELE